MMRDDKRNGETSGCFPILTILFILSKIFPDGHQTLRLWNRLEQIGKDIWNSLERVGTDISASCRLKKIIFFLMMDRMNRIGRMTEVLEWFSHSEHSVHSVKNASSGRAGGRRSALQDALPKCPLFLLIFLIHGPRKN